MIYQLAATAAHGFMWGLLHGLLIFVACAALYLIFSGRECGDQPEE